MRKISYGEGVERVFPIYSPMIESVKVIRRGKVRRAKLYYLRDRRGKSARIVERAESAEAKAARQEVEKGRVGREERSRRISFQLPSSRNRRAPRAVGVSAPASRGVNARDRRDHELGDAQAARDLEAALAEIDEQHRDFTAVILIDRAWRVEHGDTMLERKARSAAAPGPHGLSEAR